jgi:putative DNA primase/helicase
MISGEVLDRFTKAAPASAKPESSGGFDIGGYLKFHNFEISRTKPWGSQPDGMIYELATCPFDPAHVNGSATFTLAGGMPGFRCHHNGCNGRNIKDVLARYPAPKRVASNAGWGKPEPLHDELPPVPPLSKELLPVSLRQFAADISYRMQVPIDFPAAALILSLAGAVNRRATIQPKANDSGWIVVPNLWGGIVAPPGCLKSPVIQTATRPLNQIQSEWHKEFDIANADYSQVREEDELRHSAWKEDYKKATKSGRSGPERPFTYAIEPVLRRVIVNDATFEMLHQIMSENPAGILVVRDELTGWLSQLDRAGREGERAFCLQAWNGDTGHDIDRIGRGTIHVEACCMSLMGGIQPGRLRSYLSDAIKDGPGNDGLMQRFQILVWPDIDPKWQYVDVCPDPILAAGTEGIFSRLISLDAASPLRFRFSPEAQELFVQWIGELEAKIRGADLHPALVAHLSKYRSLMPSLALLFELADLACFEGFDGLRSATPHAVVTLEHAIQAAEWCDYLESHAQRVYSCAVSPQLRGARELLSHIKKKRLRSRDGGFDWFSARDVYTKGWTGLDNPDAVRAAAAVLEDAAWVRSTRSDTGASGGRPSIRYEVNPEIWK